MTVLDIEHDERVAPPSSGAATAQLPGTILPRRPGPSAGAPQRRAIVRISRDDVMMLTGAAVSGLCTTMLLFGRLTPFDGGLGFVVVGFALFLAKYGVLVSLTDDGPAVADRVMTVLLASAAAVAFAALVSVVVFVLYRGRHALLRTNTYVDDLRSTGPLDGLDKGGLAHAVIGTLIVTALTLVFTVPLGVTCAVFLTESKGRFAGLVRTLVTAMTALPSILAGLLVFSTWILILGFERSGLAASIAVSIVMLPIIIRASDVVLRLVPGNLREAAAALGASQWRVVWHVVLPTARSGLTTAVILGVARGVGETAPVLLTAGFASSINLDPRHDSMATLPLVAFQLVRSPQRSEIARGFAAAAVLMVLVLLLFAIARVLGGRPAGRQSRSQARRAAGRSARDLRRIGGASS